MTTDGWTTTPPTEPGWYWLYDADYSERDMVYFDGKWTHFLVEMEANSQQVADGEQYDHEAWEVGRAKWIGPLPEPEPPTE